MSKTSLERIIDGFFYQFSTDSANDNVLKNPSSLGERLMFWMIASSHGSNNLIHSY
jgi:hypothetical protein